MNKTKLQCGVFVKELLRQLVRSTQLNALDATDAINDGDSEVERKANPRTD